MDEYGEQQTMQFDVGLSNLASSGLDCTSQCCYQPPPQQIVYSPAAVPATVPTGDYWQPMYPYTRGLDNQCASQIVNSPSQPAPSIGTSSRVPHSPARKSMRQIVTKEEKQLICLEFETGTKQSDLSRKHKPSRSTPITDNQQVYGACIIGMSRLVVLEGVFDIRQAQYQSTAPMQASIRTSWND